jgi:hypothetical protein
MRSPQAYPVVAALQQAHFAWRKEIGQVLAPVRMPEASVWARWEAARYLTTDFGPRLGREQQVLIALAERLPVDQGVHLWALGELLESLCRHLCELGHMAQSGPAFANAVNKLVRAFDFWCVEAEAALAAAAAGGLAPDIVRELEPLLDRANAAAPA